MPGPLLRDPRLAESARLLWMVSQLEPQRCATGVLERRAGLSRHTVLRGLAQLQCTGWLPAPKGPDAAGDTAGAGSGGVADMPRELLLDPWLDFRPKVLYARLQLIPRHSEQEGNFTYPGLSRLTGASPNTLKRAVNALQATGWLEAAQAGKFSPVRFALRNPAQESQQAEVQAATRRLESAPCLGKALMWEYLSLIADSDEYIDDCQPGFMIKFCTLGVLQFDRYYYRPQVVFEYHGPQHDAASAEDTEAARRQLALDYLRAGICVHQGIRLVTVSAAELTLAAMRQKVEGLLPRRDLFGRELSANFLAATSESYQRRVLP